MNPLPPMAGIWLSAIGDLNLAEPDTIGGFPGGQTGAWQYIELMKTSKMGDVCDKAGDSWEICGLGFMRMQRPLGSVLIW